MAVHQSRMLKVLPVALALLLFSIGALVYRTCGEKSIANDEEVGLDHGSPRDSNSLSFAAPPSAHPSPAAPVASPRGILEVRGAQGFDSATPEQGATTTELSDLTDKDTLALLRELRGAYEASNQALGKAALEALLVLPEYEHDVALLFYRETVHAELSLIWHDGFLAGYLNELLLSRWPGAQKQPSSEVFHALCTFVAEVGLSNPAAEMMAVRARAPMELSDSMLRERYLSLTHCPDQRVLMTLIEKARIEHFSVGDQSTPLPIVGTLQVCKSPAEDRIGLLQLAVVDLLLKMKAKQHLGDLWEFSQRVQMMEIRSRAYSAYLELGGKAAVADLSATLMTEFSSGSARQIDAAVASLVTALEASATVTDAYELSALVLSGLREDGRESQSKWASIANEIARGAGRRRLDDSEIDSLIGLLSKETDSATAMVWVSALGEALAGRFHSGAEAVARRHLLAFAVAEGDTASNISFQCNNLWHGYSELVRTKESAHLYFETFEQVTKIATEARRHALVSTVLRGIWNHARLDGGSGSLHDRASVLVLRELPKAVRTEVARTPGMSVYGRLIYWPQALAKLQTQGIFDGLTDLAAKAETPQIQSFYLECLVAWQKESDK